MSYDLIQFILYNPKSQIRNLPQNSKGVQFWKKIAQLNGNIFFVARSKKNQQVTSYKWVSFMIFLSINR